MAEDNDAMDCPKSPEAITPTRLQATLQGLLPELHLHIFTYLGPVTSTCLGLTCKEFYAIHRETYPKTDLYTIEDLDIPHIGKRQVGQLKLHYLLRNWMSRGGFVWGGKYNCKFITYKNRELKQLAMWKFRERRIFEDYPWGVIIRNPNWSFEIDLFVGAVGIPLWVREGRLEYSKERLELQLLHAKVVKIIEARERLDEFDTYRMALLGIHDPGNFPINMGSLE